MQRSLSGRVTGASGRPALSFQPLAVRIACPHSPQLRQHGRCTLRMRTAKEVKADAEASSDSVPHLTAAAAAVAAALLPPAVLCNAAVAATDVSYHIAPRGPQWMVLAALSLAGAVAYIQTMRPVKEAVAVAGPSDGAMPAEVAPKQDIGQTVLPAAAAAVATEAPAADAPPASTAASIASTAAIVSEEPTAATPAAAAANDASKDAAPVALLAAGAPVAVTGAPEAVAVAVPLPQAAAVDAVVVLDASADASADVAAADAVAMAAAAEAVPAAGMPVAEAAPPAVDKANTQSEVPVKSEAYPTKAYQAKVDELTRGWAEAAGQPAGAATRHLTAAAAPAAQVAKLEAAAAAAASCKTDATGSAAATHFAAQPASKSAGRSLVVTVLSPLSWLWGIVAAIWAWLNHKTPAAAAN